MNTLLIVLVLLVAAEHVFILWLEMFAVPSALAARVFGISQAVQSQPEIRRLFANQGLYNGFLVAALIWALVAGVSGPGWQMAVYGLSCVIVAGLYGAATVSRRVLFVQALPAALGRQAVAVLLSIVVMLGCFVGFGGAKVRD